MFENKAKGWHGSYSVIGKISAEKFHVIVKKNEILKEKKRKKKVNLFLFPSDSFDKKEKIKPEDKDIDIFDPKKDRKVSKKEKEKKEHKYQKHTQNCFNTVNTANFSSHYLHHKEIAKQIKKMKEHENLYVTSMKYNPRMDVIWRKVISGPKWNTISGREKRKDFNIKNAKFNGDKNFVDKINLKKSSSTNIKSGIKIKRKKGKNNGYIFYDHMNAIIMNKQTARGELPIYYDNRIRNVKPFINKSITKTNSNDNISKSAKKSKESKNMITNANINNLRMSLSSNNNSNELLRSYSTKMYSTSKIKKINSNNLQPSTPSPSQNIKAINFSKIISREQLNYINRDKDEIHPFFMPSYKMVEPRSVSMVSYSEKQIHKPASKRMKGVDPNLFFDPNKVINKYNNHIETNAPNFKIMMGRTLDKNPFPTYMINKFDRFSMEQITEKGLRMNSHLNSKFNKKFSTFYPKKSFNKLINNNFIQNEKFPENCLGYIVKECFSDEKLRKSIEYYNKDVNYYLEQNNLKRNFDGITFTTYKESVKKYNDKEFFEKCFDDKYNGFA